jgi:two-component system, NarL family, sensor histidine kinase DevS
LQALADSTAVAMENVRVYEELEEAHLQTMQRVTAAAEDERRRWARELHDQTLQSLASVRMGLAAQLKRPELETAVAAITDAVAQLETEIGSLRSLITDLRPAALDDLGAEHAIRDLADRARERGLEVELAIDLAYEQGRVADRHVTELEAAVYRLVQEALTNAIKHGRARRAVVEIKDDHTTVRVTVRDDGDGFDPTSKSNGFGLLGMQERAELLGGTVEIESAPGNGTAVRAELPAQRRRPGDRQEIPRMARD